MNTIQKQRLLISRSSAKQGSIYEIISDGGDYKLEVELSVITEKMLKIIPIVTAWEIKFLSSKDSTVAWVIPNTLEVKLSSPEGAPKGRVFEAPFSKMGKAMVENEFGKVLGWIDYGLKKDSLFLGNKKEVGFVARLSMNDLPLVLPPSTAYLADRFELVHNLEQEFDDRLIYAWICRKIWQERNN